MRSNLLPIALLAAITLGGAAFAGTTAATGTTPVASVAQAAATPADLTGSIKSINSKGGYVVINGWKYHLPKGFDLTGFKVGEKVLVTFTMNGNKHEVSAMKAAV